MPDNEASAEAVGRTAEEWETEYKKLQRKEARKQSRINDLTTQVAEQRATSARIETMIERLLDPTEDAEFQQQLVKQREVDTTAARLTSEVEALLDDKDLNFQTDPRLAEARRIYEEINRTGNMALADAMKQSINAITGTGDADKDSPPGDVQQQIADAIATDRKERARVDGGQTTAPNPQSVSRSDLRNLDPSQMTATEMKELTKKALDQMTG